MPTSETQAGCERSADVAAEVDPTVDPSEHRRALEAVAARGGSDVAADVDGNVAMAEVAAPSRDFPSGPCARVFIWRAFSVMMALTESVHEGAQ